METKGMEKNALLVSKLLVHMNDGAPGFYERIKAYFFKDKQGQFFFNKEYLLQHHSAFLSVFLWWAIENSTYVTGGAKFSVGT